MGKWHLIQNQQGPKEIFKEPPLISYHKEKTLKRPRQLPPPPTPHNPSLQQNRRYFRAEKVTGLRLLFAIEFAHPGDRVTRRSVYRSPLKNVISYSPGSGRHRRPWYPRIALKVNIYIFGLTKCTIY